METLAMIRHSFGEESMSRTRKVQIAKTEKGVVDDEKKQEHAHHFLCHQGAKNSF
jgi:hypothetical protein